MRELFWMENEDFIFAGKRGMRILKAADKLKTHHKGAKS
jgi:hypothetical protein